MSDDEDENFFDAESGDDETGEKTKKKSSGSPVPSPSVPVANPPELEGTRRRLSSMSPISTAESGNNVTTSGLSEMADTLIRHLAEKDQEVDGPVSPQHDLMNGDETSEEEGEEGEWGGGGGGSGPISHSNDEIDSNNTQVNTLKKTGTGKGEALPADFDHDSVYKMSNSETGEVYDLRTGLPWGAVASDNNDMFSLRGLIPTRELLIATARKEDSDLPEIHRDDTSIASSSSSSSTSSSTTNRRQSIFARGIHKVNKRMKEKLKHTDDPAAEATKKGATYVPPGHEEVGDHVKVAVHSKRWSEWSSLFLVQGISAHDGPIWCLSWSPSGVFLASAGQDACINVWKVVESKEDMPARWKEKSFTARNSSRSWNCPVVREEAMPDPNDIPMAESGEDPSGFPLAQPWRRWKEHSLDIVDLSWNQNDFLLSASIDRTVRLWHVSSTECLHVFPHADLVTSVDFHPKNDLLFLTGCFDKRLRVWSIPESHVAAWATTPEMITSVCFSPSGNQALAGLFNGQVFFWHTDSQGLDSAQAETPSSSQTPTPTAFDMKKGDAGNGTGTAVAAVAARLMAESHVRLRYYTQVEARNRRGKFHEGRKVTGLSWLPAQALRNKETKGNFAPAPGANVEEASNKVSGKVVASTKSMSTSNLPQQLLVTTNDSRVRLFQMETFSQLCKFKGLMNENMQIRSSFSCDGKYVVSGSENGHVHIWNTSNDYESAQEMSGEHLQNVGGKRWLPATGGRHDRNQAHESFRATHATKVVDEKGAECSMPAIATAAVFAPFSTVSLAAAASDVHMLYTDLEQLANSIIVVADYSGQLRFFMRASADDEIDNFGDVF